MGERQSIVIRRIECETSPCPSWGAQDKIARPLSVFSSDKDFELVLRHFWKHLDAEKRRKLIQLAAGLVEGDRKER
jgi:hypothetical protein